ncbi:MAG: SPOR domain-containing protein [Lysobacterales bacterium]
MNGLRRFNSTAWLTAIACWLGGPVMAETTCIIADDGQSWRCGTAEELANVRPGRIRKESDNRSLPPPLLIDPSRLPRIEYDSAAAAGFAGGPNSASSTAAEPATAPPPRPEEAWLQTRPAASSAGSSPTPPSGANPTAPAGAVSQPAATAAVADAAPAQVAPLQPDRSAEPAPVAAAATSTPEPEPVPAPAPAAVVAPAPSQTRPADPSTATRSTAASPPAPTSATAPPPQPAPAVAAPVPSRTTTPLDLRPRSLADWQSNEYTVQLVAAASPEGFDQFARQAGLASESLFVIRLRHPDADWWLLCSGRHANLAQAQAALAQLPDAARSHGAWPRRIGPLQKDAQP